MFTITYMVGDEDGILETKTKTLVADEVHHMGPWVVAVILQEDGSVLRVHVPFESVVELTETITKSEVRAARRFQKAHDERERKEARREVWEDSTGYA